MPSTAEYTCKHCGNQVDVLVKSFDLGLRPIFPNDPKQYKTWEKETLQWLEVNTKTYVCDRCWLSLTVPQNLIRMDWEAWKRSSIKGYHPYTEYPFLISIVSKIDAALNQNSRLPVDLGTIACPYCTKELAIRREFLPTCAECGSNETKLTGGGIASVKGPWPPIA